MSDSDAVRGQPSWKRALVGFALMFVTYQLAEALQTIYARNSAIGPALMLFAVLIAWPIGRWLGGNGYATFGLATTRPALAVLAGGFVLAALAKVAALGAGLAVGAYGPAAAAPPGLGVVAVGVALLTTFVPSVAEDILTRGFLLRVFPVRLGGIGFVLASALLYTLNHLWRFDWGASEQVRLFCLGLAYGAAAWRWRTLWGAVALHWGWNCTSVLAERIVPVDGLSVVGIREVSAWTHLSLLAIVLLLPARPSKP